MQQIKGDSKKTTVIRGGTLITLGLLRELAGLIQADCVGPIVGTALKIIEIVEGAKANKEDCLELKNRLENLMIIVLAPLQGKTDADLDSDLKRSLDRLSATLIDVYGRLRSLEGDVRSKLRGSLVHQQSAEKIRGCKESLGWAMQVFQVDSSIQSRLEEAKRHLQSQQKLDKIVHAVSDLDSRLQGLALASDEPIRTSMYLPSAPKIFHGRDEIVEDAVKLLAQTKQARVFLCGPGGIGKTALALAVVHDYRVAKCFGDRRYWVPCDQAPTPEALIQIIARSMDIPIPSTSTNRFRDLAAIIRTSPVPTRLLILDSFETTWYTVHQAEVRTILSVLASIQSVSILMMTRDADSTSFGLAWSTPPLRPLGQLTLEAARKAYLQHIPDAIHDQQLDRLLSTLDCYPLAITLVAGQRVLGESTTSLLERWEAEKSRLLSEGFDKHTNLDISSALSINSRAIQANPEALQVLGMLALLPAGRTIKMLPPFPDLRRHINTLIKVSLAARDRGNSLITTLSPISAFVLQHHPPTANTINLLVKEHDRLLHGFHSAALVSEAREHCAIVLAYEAPNIHFGLRYSLVHGDQRKTSRTTIRYTEWENTILPQGDLLRFALEHVDADAVWPERGHAWSTLSRTLVLLARFPEAREAIHAAISSFDAVGDRYGLAQSQNSLGDILRLESRLTEAKEMLQAAKSTYTDLGHTVEAKRCERSLAEILDLESRHPKSADVLQIGARQATAAYFGTIGDLQRVAQSQKALGGPLVANCRFAEARKAYQVAMFCFEAVGDRLGAAQCQMQLGLVLRDEGRYPEAERHVRLATKTFEEAGASYDLAFGLFTLGALASVGGGIMEARKCVERSLVVFREIGHTEMIRSCEQLLTESSKQ